MAVDSISDRDVLPPHMLKKYISYARHTVFPKLSMEACGVIKEFYIQLRENACISPNTLPITSRTLDSLIRLTQARAKLELRSIVNKEDAYEVVQLIQESIFEACYSEMGVGANVQNQFGGNNFNSGVRGGAAKAGKGGQIDPNDIGLLSIPKQTKIFMERLR